MPALRHQPSTAVRCDLQPQDDVAGWLLYIAIPLPITGVMHEEGYQGDRPLIVRALIALRRYFWFEKFTLSDPTRMRSGEPLGPCGVELCDRLVRQPGGSSSSSAWSATIMSASTRTADCLSHCSWWCCVA